MILIFFIAFGVLLGFLRRFENNLVTGFFGGVITLTLFVLSYINLPMGLLFAGTVFLGYYLTTRLLKLLKSRHWLKKGIKSNECE